MKHIFSVVLASLLVICLLGVSPANTPVRAQEGTTYIYLPLVSRQLAISANSVKIAVGAQHSCAITPTGEVKCWGQPDYGMLGDGSGEARRTPVYVAGLKAQVTALASSYSHTCALLVNGAVQCWGYNRHGQLGDGTYANRLSAVSVSGLPAKIKAITTGFNHTCALTEQGGVLCWGGNEYGQLGDGTTVDHFTPASVVGLTSGVRAVSAGANHTCAIAESGGVKCWGFNGFGQLGDGTLTSHNSYPVDVLGMSSGTIAVAAGDSDSCVITDENKVKCWRNIYFWNDPKAVPSTVPWEVPEFGKNVVALSNAATSKCVLTSDGGAKCWGNHNGSTLENPTGAPVDVDGLSTGVAAVSTSYFHTCALLNQGTVKCWGQMFTSDMLYGSETPVDIIGFP